MDPININFKDISSMCRACLTISDNSASFISLEKDLEARNVFMKTSGNFVRVLVFLFYFTMVHIHLSPL